MKNYILKAAVIAGQIDSVNGSTVYFVDGDTLEVDDAFITQQMPVSGDYVADGEVIKRAEFEGIYCEEVDVEPIDEGEVIDGLRQELHTATEEKELAYLEIEELKSRLAVDDNVSLDDSPEPVDPEGSDTPDSQ